MVKRKKVETSFTDLYTVSQLVGRFLAIFDHLKPDEIAASALEALARQGNLEAKRVLRAWSKDKGLPVDEVFERVKVGAPLKEKLFELLKTYARQVADGAAIAALPNLVQRSVDSAGSPTADKDNKLMIRHLEKQGIFNPPPGQQTNINVSANAQSGVVNRGLMPFEDTLQMFDQAERRELPARKIKQLKPAESMPIDVEARTIKENA